MSSRPTTDLERGRVRIGIAGKVMGGADARYCLDSGADLAIIGRYVLTVDVSGGSGPTTTTTPTTVPDETSNPPAPKTTPVNRLTASSPARLLDTRDPDAQSGRLGAGENIRVPVAGAAGIPITASAS